MNLFPKNVNFLSTERYLGGGESLENFKNFKAPELNYVILVQLKLPVWWSEAYLLEMHFG